MLPAQRVLGGNGSIVTGIKPQNNNELCSVEDKKSSYTAMILIPCIVHKLTDGYLYITF